MSSVLRRLRGALGFDDAPRAYRSETRDVREAAAPPAPSGPVLSPEQASQQDIMLGTTLDAPVRIVALPVREFLGLAHILTLGASGSGKSRLTAHVIMEVIRRVQAGRQRAGVIVIDPKSDLVPLVRELLAADLDALDPEQRGQWLSSYVVIDPFDRERLVPLQVLRPEPGLDPEIQALDACSLLTRLSAAELGVKQLMFAYHLFLLGIAEQLSLPGLAAVLADTDVLRERAASSPRAEVREFFAHGGNLTTGSLEGVRARLHRLLQVPSLRKMFGAKDCVSFERMFDDRAITLIDTGSAPAGLEDAGRAVMGFLVTKLTRAIFARTQTDAELPVSIHIDEWQEVLASSGQPAEQFERLLAMTRSRGVSLHLISQSLAGAAKVSGALVDIVKTNATIQIVGRASMADAHAFESVLPVTGRRPRPKPAPWEEKAHRPWLTEDEERKALANDIPSLPDRRFYVWYRRAHRHAALFRTVNVVAHPARLPASLRQLLKHGQAAVAVSELEPAAAARFRTAPPKLQLVHPAGRKPRGFG